MIGIPCRSIDRLVTERFQIGYDFILMNASYQEVHVLSRPQISISFQSKSPNESVIDALFFEEIGQSSEYRLYIQDKLNIQKKEQVVNKKDSEGEISSLTRLL